jgi:hypothetical protein
MRLPIGIQDFTKLRESNYLYVDKTMYLMPFLEGGAYFFSRPRRFGKSLLLSTLAAAFLGRKDLFSNLWLEHHFDFEVRPVIRLDLSRLDFRDQSLQVALMDSFRQSAREYGLTLSASTAKSAFEELIFELSKNGKVVVLIDEYDKPITDYLLEPEKRSEHQAILKSIYGVLKPMDAHLHLIVLTGVSKIGKLSLFSDLNNLEDISLDPNYAGLCGYSRAEIELVFSGFLESLVSKFGLTHELLWQQLTYWYNGYSWDGETRVYCPFSFLLVLKQKVFKSFWFETGTPSFLLDLIRSGQLNPLEFDRKELDVLSISSADVENLDAISLMFQTGYLTIISKNLYAGQEFFTLGYPNQEVRQAFSSSLIGEYSRLVPSQVSQFGVALLKALLILDWNTLFATVNQVLASIPYEIFPRKEAYIHSLMHLMLTSTGLRTTSQVQTSLGRMDTLVQSPTHSIILEYKTIGTAKDALDQIEISRYADGLEKPVVKIGVFFDLELKCITDWASG